MSHKDKSKKMNCWEFTKCGRERGGLKTAELGVCPASIETVLDGVHGGVNSGRACWVMEGTLCAASVQGSFWDKFKKCVTCSFFHEVEAEEGRTLKNAKELLHLVETRAPQEVAEKIPAKPHAVAVCRGCGQELNISMSPNWKLNIVGLLEFECRRCGRTVRTKGLLAEKPEDIVVLK